MKSKHLLTFILLLIIESTNACQCVQIDSASAKEVMNEMEFVIIGHAVRNVGFKSHVNTLWDERNKGFDVFIEVDSVIKGSIDAKTIVVKQFGGNCNQIFTFGNQYVIMGNQLDKFGNKNSNPESAIHEKMLQSSIPPPQSPMMNNRTLTSYNGSDEFIRFWNRIKEKHIILNTSMCTAFEITSRKASYFLKN